MSSRLLSDAGRARATIKFAVFGCPSVSVLENTALEAKGSFSFLCLPVALMKVKRRSHRFRRNLVDPASSHMLVSKIKPCMS